MLSKECITVSDLLQNAVLTAPHKEAIYDGQRRLNYTELDNESNAIALGLQQMGIEKGDHIAVCLPNWHEFIIIVFAIAKVGAVLIPLNTSYKIHEIQYILDNSKIKVAFLAEEFEGNMLFDHFFQVLQKSKCLKYLISVRFENKNIWSYMELINKNNGCILERNSVTSEDVFIIMYTSGTTGKPKGVMLSHKNLVELVKTVTEFLNYKQQDAVLCQLPIFHLFGMHTCILCSIKVGAKIVLMEKYKPEKVLQLIESEKVTVHHGVPSMFILELNHPKLNFYDLSSLRIGITAGAPMPPGVIGEIREKMNYEVLVSYGMTESSTTLTCARIDDDDYIKSETVGRAMPGVTLRILDPHTRKELAPGNIGEIVAHSPGIMKGYFEMEVKTKEVLSDGWYFTGDLGKIDSEGNLIPVGRRDDLIIRGGYNIFPKEIEEFLYKHESVLETAIVGLPDTVLGEIVCAVIKLKNGKSITIPKLKKFISDKLADYKVPDKFVVVSDLPKSASGKINKYQLTKQMEQILAQELR